VDPCRLHPDRAAVGTCERCARPACLDCAIPVRGGLRCAECAAEEFPSGGGYPVRVNGPRAPVLRAEGALLASAAAFFAITFVPAWYRVGGEQLFGLPIPPSRQDAWGGATLFAAVAAGLAILWIVVRRLWLAERATTVDAALGAAGLVLTLAGLFLGRAVPNAEAGASWGFLAGLPLAALWTASGVRRARRARRPSRASGFA